MDQQEQVTRSAELISTGAAATLLGTSRQHVVDLCERGGLRYVLVGTHRRVRRRDIEDMVGPPGGLTRDQRRSLWLHQAVAGELVRDPESVVSRGRRNLDRLDEIHRGGRVGPWLDRWRALLAGPLDEILHVLTSTSTPAIDLRQNTPFAGVLDDETRLRILRAFRAAPHST